MNNIRNEFLSGRFECTEDGIYIPRVRALVQGVFIYHKRGEPEEYSENMVVNEGLDYILKAAFGETSPISNWYIVPFSGAGPVLDSWTGANIHTVATEWTNYTPATRPPWNHDPVASQAVDSFNTKASFTSTQASQTVTGAGLVSAQTKSAGTGTLIAASMFPSSKGLDATEVLDIGYGLQLATV